MSATPRSLFTNSLQRKFKRLCNQKLPSLKTATSEIVSWILLYINNEHVQDVNTICQDLLDPDYSDIKSNIQSKFKWDDNSTKIICDILLNDIFNTKITQNNYNSMSYLTSFDDDDDDDKITFYSDAAALKNISSSTRNEFDRIFAAVIDTPNDNNDNVPSITPQTNVTNINIEIESLKSPQCIALKSPKSPKSTTLSLIGGSRNTSIRNQKNQNNQLLLSNDVTELRPLKSFRNEEVIEEDEFLLSENEKFPLYLNVALFGRSDDEILELLIDKAVLKIIYGNKFNKLWNDPVFIREIYSDKLFPKAVNKIFDEINDIKENEYGYGFIGSFVAIQFKKQIKEYKRKIDDNTACNEQIDNYRKSANNLLIKQQITYYVFWHRNEYLIVPTKRNGKGEYLTSLTITENSKYSWCVFKKKRIHKENIVSKGFWEIIEPEDDEKRDWRQVLSTINGARDKTHSTKVSTFLGMTGIGAMSRGIVDDINSSKDDIKDESKDDMKYNININNNKNKNKSITPNLSKRKNKKNKSKKQPFPYIPLIHLNIIFEFLQFHYRWSIDDDITQKRFELENKTLCNATFWDRYCSKNRKKYLENKSKTSDPITIGNIRYTLVWWNNERAGECNSFVLQIGDNLDSREYYYMRFKHDIPKMRWDWYDNDKSKYEKYSRGKNDCVYKELEASFQSNIDKRFPQSVFNKAKKFKDVGRMFDICLLPKLKETLNLNTKIKRKFFMRFTFTENSNRITNLEQLSIWTGVQNQQKSIFPRNVRRLIGKRNTIYFYAHNAHEYIEEWKRRYLLSTLQQQKYFYSMILCICAIIKYIEIEFSHQMISFPYPKPSSKEGGLWDGLDDNDVQRHRRDFELWDGFFIPPEHQFQTNQIGKSIANRLKNKYKNKKNKIINKKKDNKREVKRWYKSLAFVESLKKFIYKANQQHKKSRKMLGSNGKIQCKHIVNENSTLWLSNNTQEVYCNRCGILLQFSECIRKYVLESENNEIIDFLWPWYRNYFHRRDIKKYHTYIAKYNLSHLFMIKDVIFMTNKINNNEKNNINTKNNICCCLDNKNKNKNLSMASLVHRDDERDLSQLMLDESRLDEGAEASSQRTQIRHLRKFAAHVLLGGWDILRNLNIIRNQLQCIFGFFDDDHDDDDNDNIVNLNKDWQDMIQWKDWREFINQINKDLADDLNNSKARKLMELHHEDQLSMNHTEQGIFAGLIDVILDHSKIYNENPNDLEDGYNNKDNDKCNNKDNDADDDDDNDDDTDVKTSQSESPAPTDHSLADDNIENQKYYVEFRKSFCKVPGWWFDQHDKLLLELALKFNWDKQSYKNELRDPAKKQYYQVLLRKPDAVKRFIYDFAQRPDHYYDKYFDDEQVLSDLKTWSKQSPREITKDQTAIKFFSKISESIYDEDDKEPGFSSDDDSDDDDGTDEDIINNNNDINFDYSDDEDDDYVGYQEFQVWCENWRNIQHRLRYLTFIICDYLSTCNPSMICIRIPDTNHQIEQYKTKSIAFLNGYMEHVHCMNCKQDTNDLDNINKANFKLRKLADDIIYTNNSNVNNDDCNDDNKTMPHKNKLVKPGLSTPILLPARSSLVIINKHQLDNFSLVLEDERVKKLIAETSSKRIHINKSKYLLKHRIRDPFMRRDLNFELKQICQSFDLLEYGVEMATFLISLLKRKQLDALWSALGTVLEYMPYENARYILVTFRSDLRHGKPQQLKSVCDHLIRGSSFIVHICLFLADYMETNADSDLARYNQWIEYSRQYESQAGAMINTIESNHLLAVLMDIPLSYSAGTKVSLLQVALEQNRAEFLNNERINAVMAHVWQSPSGLAPDTEIIQKTDSYFDIWVMCFNQPFHFYLTPMGFNATIKTLHIFYCIFLYIFIWHRQYLEDGMASYECFLWSLNVGYIVYEMIEAYDKGLRAYFSVAGWVNYWDLGICFVWIILLAIRCISVAWNYCCFIPVLSFDDPEITESDECHDFCETNDLYDVGWSLNQIYMMLWAIQIALLSGRSLVLFQTSDYFGVLLRMMLQLMEEMFKFMFVLGLLLVGFVFGLYYIQGGYKLIMYCSESVSSLNDWYEGFKYLFQLTVGAGDFSEIECIVNEVPAQVFVIIYLIIAAILMMNLLIALLTTTYENIHKQARTASSFAFAEATYDLSHRSRFLPAPFCIYVLFIAIVIHLANFIPAMICPRINVYNCINHYQYEGFYKWRLTVNGCLNCKKIWSQIRAIFFCIYCRKQLHRMNTFDKRRDLIQSFSEIEAAEELEKQKNDERCCLCCRCWFCGYTNPQNQVINLSVDDKNDKNNKNNNKNKRKKVKRRNSGYNIKYNKLNKKDISDDNVNKININKKVYKLETRGRIWKYYASTFCFCNLKCIDNKLKGYRFNIYHNGCYSCIPTALGAKERVKDRSTCNGITLNQYAEQYEKHHQFNLDQTDIVLLKHLTVDSLFCKYCYRPFDPKNLDQVLLTPFWALSEILSIYIFPFVLWIPLCLMYGVLVIRQYIQDAFDNGLSVEDDIDNDYDRQYFPKEALNTKINTNLNGSNSDDD